MQHQRAKSIICLAAPALAVFLLFTALPLLARADNITVQGGDQVPSQNIVPGLPGGTNAVNTTTPEGVAGMVANLYDFAILIGGLLAFASILYAGIMYLTTGGNPSRQHEAKERIRDAIVGLLLLLGIYLVLNLINPDLTHLRFPTLKQLSPPAVGPVNVGYACVDALGSKQVGQCYASSDCNSACPKGTQCLASAACNIVPVSANTVYAIVERVISNTYGDQPTCQKSCSTNLCQQVTTEPSLGVTQTSWGCLSNTQLPQLACFQTNGDCNTKAAQMTSSADQSTLPDNFWDYACVQVNGNTASWCSTAGAATCNNPQGMAQANNEPYPQQNAPELDRLISCIKQTVSNTPSTYYTYDQSHSICNYTRGQTTCGACSHAVNSCHYGGKTGKDGALAVDFPATGTLANAIIAAANSCGAKEGGSVPGARCEDAQARIVSCTSAGVTHVHVNAGSCDSN